MNAAFSSAMLWPGVTLIAYLIGREIQRRLRGAPLANPVLIAIAYLAGLMPMWLWAKASGWRHRRRIAHLENALAAATPSAMMTATQLDAAAAKACEPTPHTGN